MPARRVAALLLPRLLTEIATARDAVVPGARRGPMAVILLDPLQASLPPEAQVTGQTRIDAIDECARRLGLREGLTLTEAHAFVASLTVRTVGHQQVHAALARVAEVALAFSPTVAIAPPDTVHVDLTGTAHLAGDEPSVCGELEQRLHRLGHVVRVAVASGPHIAEAVARHGPLPIAVVPPGQEARTLRELPVSALPIGEELACWLMRLGMVTVGDLARLPRAQLASRLGDLAPRVLALIDGVDTAPLSAYEPPLQLEEEQVWDEGVEQLSALAFVLKRLVTNLAARLEGRALATTALELHARLDRSIAHLRGVEDHWMLRLELPAPLYRVDDLMRALRTRLERSELPAPAVGLLLRAPAIVRAPRVQLDLSRDVTVSPDALAVLLAELSAEIGAERLGTLRIEPAHRPEARSVLVPITSTTSARVSLPQPAPGVPGTALTRQLPTPVLVGRGHFPRTGALLSLPDAAFPIEQVVFDVRLAGVEWWTASPVDRDYLHLWLRTGSAEGVCAWVYVDRPRGHIMLHGWLT